MKRTDRRWVALTTFVNDEGAGMLYEEGGIYDHEPRWKANEVARSPVKLSASSSAPKSSRSRA
jgi:hypothetical protein